MEPKEGMEFETEDRAFKCYTRYAVLQGFQYVNESRKQGHAFKCYTCYRQGYDPNKKTADLGKPRHQTRTGCLAQVTISRQPDGKSRFETEHNHEFVSPSTTHIERVNFAEAVEVDVSEGSVVDGVPKLAAYDFYNTYAGRVGFSVRKDHVNTSKIDGSVASRRFTCCREGSQQKDKHDLSVKRPI